MTERETNWLNIGMLLINVVMASLLIFLGNFLFHERARLVMEREEMTKELLTEREKIRSDSRREVRQLNKLLKWNEEVQREKQKAEAQQLARENGKSPSPTE